MTIIVNFMIKMVITTAIILTYFISLLFYLRFFNLDFFLPLLIAFTNGIVNSKSMQLKMQINYPNFFRLFFFLSFVIPIS